MVQQQVPVNDLIQSSIEVNQSILDQFESLLEQLETVGEGGLPEQLKDELEALLRSMIQTIQESLETLLNLLEQYQINERK